MTTDTIPPTPSATPRWPSSQQGLRGRLVRPATRTTTRRARSGTARTTGTRR